MSILNRWVSYGFLLTIIILFLATPDVAFADEFPVGLSLEYEIETRYSSVNNYTRTYEFTRWIDVELGQVELLVDSRPRVVTYPSGSETVIFDFPLWTDVGSWEEGGTTQFGDSYNLSRSTRNGFYCWNLRGEVDGPGDFDSVFWDIYYDRTFGFLVFYNKVNDTLPYEQTATLMDNNLNNFMFLGGFLIAPFTRILFLSGIIIELVIIYRLWDQRRGSLVTSKDEDNH